MGVIPDDQAIATIHASIEAGATFIDTAEGYRTSEGVLGKALRGRRDDVFLATKLSGDHSLEHMTSAIENSLSSLGTDYIDLYQLHGPRHETPIEETMANLKKLQDSGKIQYIGISNFNGDEHREVAQYGTVQSSQPRYNMLYRYRPGHVFPSDDERASKPEFQDDVFIPSMQIVEKLIEWAGDHGHEIAQLAIAWILAQPAVTSCIVGAKTPEQAIYNAAAGDWNLSEDDMAEIAVILGDFQQVLVR
jgi:aryl-alcohol dehydrogenase-like predicted oxidoreductase